MSSVVFLLWTDHCHKRLRNNQTVNYHVKKGLTEPILSQMNPIHTNTSYLESLLVWPSNLGLCLPMAPSVQVIRLKCCIHDTSPCVLHVPPIWSSIWLPSQYSWRSINYGSSHYTTSDTLSLFNPLRSKYSQHFVLKHHQPTYLIYCEKTTVISLYNT
jgi:hypothetical protein